MIISSITVSGYRCFSSPITVNLSHSSLSSYGVSALIGRNGAGKSTLIEALAWALFALDSADIKLSSHRLEARVDVTMECEAGLFEIHRRLKNGRSSTSGRLGALELDLAGVKAALRDRGVGDDDAVKVLLRQSCNTVALGTPLALLAFVEESAGTSQIAIETTMCDLVVVRSLQEHGLLEAEVRFVVADIGHIRPACLSLLANLKEELVLESDWVAYYETLVAAIAEQESGLVDDDEAEVASLKLRCDASKKPLSAADASIKATQKRKQKSDVVVAELSSKIKS
jgi:energy-coupling factor transporter ATP-binding protein EcfA2